MGPFWRAGRGHLCGCAMDFGASPEVLQSGLGCPTATLVAPRQPRPSPRGPQVFSMIFEVRACVNRNLYPVCWASQRAVSILFPKPSRLRFFPRAWDCPPSTISRRARACVIALAAGRHSPPSSDGGVVHLVPPKWPLRPPPLTVGWCARQFRIPIDGPQMRGGRPPRTTHSLQSAKYNGPQFLDHAIS